MNIVITGKCNRSCPYCFAKGKMQSDTDAGNKNTGPVAISLQNFDKCLDFLKKSSRRRLNILGGEPTLHPVFEELIRHSLD